MKESLRTRARELVLQALYAADHGEKDPNQALDELLVDESLAERVVLFARNLLRLVVENAAAADQHIARLADNWNLDRIAAIDRTVLRMAMTELELVPETPVKVVLNEAIELAKKFSTMESSKFVNGILDRFVKQRISRSLTGDEP